MGLGTRFDPGVIGTPLSVVGGLLDELVGALAKSAKGCEGDGLEADVQVLLLNDLVRAAILLGGHLVGGETTWCLTRLGVDVSVDGGVRDADVQPSGRSQTAAGTPQSSMKIPELASKTVQ